MTAGGAQIYIPLCYSSNEVVPRAPGHNVIPKGCLPEPSPELYTPRRASLTLYSATVNVSFLVPGGPESKGTGKKSSKKRQGSQKAEHRMQ